MSRVEGRRDTESRPVLTIEYSDFQDIQVIHDRMNAAKYILGSNTRICETFPPSLSGEDSPRAGLLLEELRLQGARVDNLLERTRSGSGLVSDDLHDPPRLDWS